MAEKPCKRDVCKQLFDLFRERLSEKVNATIPIGFVCGFELPSSKKFERMAREAVEV